MVKHVLDEGVLKNRTGTDTLMSFEEYYKVDLLFPFINNKKVFFNSVIRMIVYLPETHIRNLREHTKIRDAWTSKEKTGKLEK